MYQYHQIVSTTLLHILIPFAFAICHLQFAICRSDHTSEFTQESLQQCLTSLVSKNHFLVPKHHKSQLHRSNVSNVILKNFSAASLNPVQSSDSTFVATLVSRNVRQSLGLVPTLIRRKFILCEHKLVQTLLISPASFITPDDRLDCSENNLIFYIFVSL